MARELLRVGGRGLTAAALCGALLVFAGMVPRTGAADMAKVWVGFDKPEKFSEIGTELSTRPNKVQAIYIGVENKSGDPQKMTVILRARAAGVAKFQEVATAVLGDVKNNEKKVVTQWNVVAPQPAPPPAVPPAPPAPPPPFGLDFLGPNFDLQIEVMGTEIPLPGAKPAKPAEAKSLVKTPDLNVRVMAPTEYITISSIKYVSKTSEQTNRLSVTVQALPTFIGSPCEVALDLRPDMIPGLIVGEKTGAYKQFLTKAGESVELFAENLAFKGSPPTTGWVYITVDGNERAFRFATDFTKEEGTPEIDKKPTLRMRLPGRYLLPTEKLRVGLDVDNYPSDLTLKVGIDRNDDGKLSADEMIEKSGPRATAIRLMLGPDGSVQLKTDVKPWEIDLPADGLRGEFNVIAWGNYKIKEGVTTKEITLLPEDTAETTAKVTFDDRPPANVKFLLPDSPLVLEVGKPLPLVATATAGKVPFEAVFFVGKAIDKKLPPDPIKVDVVPVKGKDGVWVAKGELALPPEVKSPAHISVRFTNAVGLSTFANMLVAWGPAPPVKPFIAGTVIEGDLAQPEISVALRDANGKVLDTVATNGKGEYIFKNVVPGTYRVYSAKSGGSRGETTVTVLEGQKKEGVVVKLTR